jgi:hypothetical protein
MTYLGSPSLRIVPVPGIGFCNTIFVDRGPPEGARHPVPPFALGWWHGVDGWRPSETAEPAAPGHWVQ